MSSLLQEAIGDSMRGRRMVNSLLKVVILLGVCLFTSLTPSFALSVKPVDAQTVIIINGKETPRQVTIDEIEKQFQATHYWYWLQAHNAAEQSIKQWKAKHQGK